MTRLYLDVATSAFATDRKTGDEPRVIRLAWWRDSEDDPVCRLIKPSPGTVIHPSTVPYHRLTLERLGSDGVDADGAVAELEWAARGCLSLISFNQDYHLRNLHRLMGRVGAPIPTTAVCAMKLATPILAIPAMRPGNPLKSPNLREACEFFGVEPPSTADDPIELAMSTVRAVRGVYEGCLAKPTK